jgi:hypothetical protein
MTSMHRLGLVAAVTLALGGALASAKVKVDTQFDKARDFKPYKTYAWHPDGVGDVKILQSMGDDPAAVRKRYDPLIVSTVDQLLVKQGLTPAPAAEASLFVNYYILIGPGGSSQSMGQFLAPVPVWGLPPFAPSTSALTVYEQGTLLLDVADAKQRSVIWRGSAQDALERTRSEAGRDKIIRDALTQMLKKFPPKQR